MGFQPSLHMFTSKKKNHKCNINVNMLWVLLALQIYVNDRNGAMTAKNIIIICGWNACNSNSSPPNKFMELRSNFFWVYQNPIITSFLGIFYLVFFYHLKRHLWMVVIESKILWYKIWHLWNIWHFLIH